MTDTRECFVNHLGIYLCEPRFFLQAVAQIKAGTWQPRVTSIELEGDGHDLRLETLQQVFGLQADDDATMRRFAGAPAPMPDDEPARAQTFDGLIYGEGVAVLAISGPMMKGYSKYGGCSTVALRKNLRDARADDRVKALCLVIDSPGGHVSGTQQLADEVRDLAAVMPVYVQGEDLVASAAYWAAVGATKIYGTRATQFGSCGAYGLVDDLSGLYEKHGIVAHVIATGDFKAMGAPGSEITDEHLAAMQVEVEDLGGHFKTSIGEGRNLQGDGLDRVWSGKVWIAEKAQSLGLIDGIQSLDETLEQLSDEAARIGTVGASARARRRLAAARSRTS